MNFNHNCVDAANLLTLKTSADICNIEGKKLYTFIGLSFT